MARLTAPLLSFGASGQIGKTMVAATWKGIPYMRKYVTPANPNTADQVAQRATLTAAVAAWKNYFTDTECRAAWLTLAGHASSAMSAFNAFCSSASKLSATDPDGSMGDSMTEIADYKLEIDMKNINDGTAGDEAGDFEVWYGTSSSSLSFMGNKTIAMDKITTDALGSDVGVVYCKIRKGGLDRSGIYKATLILA